MDWKRVLLNVGGVAGACFLTQRADLAGPAPDWPAILMGIGMCIAANQIGLHQRKP